jgi:hypothetical protein
MSYVPESTGDMLTEVTLDGAEYVADRRAQQGQDSYHDNRHQHQYKRVFDQALTSLLRIE